MVLGVVSEPVELQLDLGDVVVGALLEADEVATRVSQRSDHLVELELQRERVAVLGVLDQDDEQQRDDRGERGRHEQPPVGEAHDRPDREPRNREEAQPDERSGRADRRGGGPRKLAGQSSQLPSLSRDTSFEKRLSPPSFVCSWWRNASRFSSNASNHSSHEIGSSASSAPSPSNSILRMPASSPPPVSFTRAGSPPRSSIHRWISSWSVVV